MESEVDEDQLRGADCNRRKWLIATSVAAGVGRIATLVPFVGSFAPSAKARAAGAPVAADISKL